MQRLGWMEAVSAWRRKAERGRVGVGLCDGDGDRAGTGDASGCSFVLEIVNGGIESYCE